MTLQKITPLVVLMFTVVCALPPAAATVVPSAIAQEEDDDYDDSLDNDDDDDNQDLASGIVSEVLEEEGGGGAAAADNDETNQDTTNTVTINPNQEQDLDQTDFNVFGDETADLTQDDQSQANVAVPIGIPIDIEVIEEEPLTTPMTPPPDGGLPPEFVAFCLQLEGESVLRCFDTSEDCAGAEEFFERRVAIISECEGVEQVPPGAGNCSVFRDDEGVVDTVSCDF